MDRRSQAPLLSSSEFSLCSFRAHVSSSFSPSLFSFQDVPGIPRLQPFLSLEQVHRLTLERPSIIRKPKSSSANPTNSLSSLAISRSSSLDDDGTEQDFFLTRYDPSESSPLPLKHLVVKADYDTEGDLESLSPLLSTQPPSVSKDRSSKVLFLSSSSSQRSSGSTRGTAWRRSCSLGRVRLKERRSNRVWNEASLRGRKRKSSGM
ncbi:hypothetical protein BDY24DRAFT_374684, partial [Mrakia frigida]|uniref:uncharacterized protein n=1 Tax=Mrakia frigida TaxID=29902 RepID=UPI003FCC1141